MPVLVPTRDDGDRGWRTDDDDVALFKTTRHNGGGSLLKDRSEVSQDSGSYIGSHRGHRRPDIQNNNGS